MVVAGTTSESPHTSQKWDCNEDKLFTFMKIGHSIDHKRGVRAANLLDDG